MSDGPEGAPPIDPRTFDREMNAKVLRFGSREDSTCPQCGKVGYRRVADSEMVALYACRYCGHQDQVVHDARPEVKPPFREYREGRGLRAVAGEESAEDGDAADR